MLIFSDLPAKINIDSNTSQLAQRIYFVIMRVKHFRMLHLYEDDSKDDGN